MAKNIPKALQIGLVMALDSAGKDWSGNGNNGTLVNSPTKVRVLQNDGLTYNGSNQRITTTSIPVTGTSITCTYSCWFRTTSSARQNLLGFGDANITNDGLQLYIYTDNKLHVDFSAVGGGNSVNTVNDGKWHLGVVVVNSGTGQLYFDAQPAGSSFGGGNLRITASGTNGKYIADRIYGDSTFMFNGSIINPMAWNRALSQKEIEMLYVSTFIK